MFGSRGRADDWDALGAQGVCIVAAEPAAVDDVWRRFRAEDGREVPEPLHGTHHGSRRSGFRDRHGNL